MSKRQMNKIKINKNSSKIKHKNNRVHNFFNRLKIKRETNKVPKRNYKQYKSLKKTKKDRKKNNKLIMTKFFMDNMFYKKI